MTTVSAGTPVDRPALPRRGAASIPSAPAPAGEALSREERALVDEALQEIRGRIDWNNVKGLLAASRDGLLLCSDTRDIEDDSVAAMAASSVGLAIQFTGRAGVGAPRAAIFEGADGHVGVFTAHEGILLVVLGERGTTMGLFNVAARQALSLFQQAVADRRVRSVRDIAPAGGEG